ncbi:MAG: PstS family phosphate ABC transporter substrate-binding protein [Bdellovibrionaceae bacterium]|nr:PstS family phosphate ABC transporter substrate-binding protein [Pseudobdellovibrionaceae bacterium]
MMRNLLFSLLSTFSFSVFAQTLVKVDGSSTVFPITEAIAEDFQKSEQGKIRVTVGISGTGGGFKKFCRGETDVQNASRPISSSEMADCKSSGVQYLELPVAYEGIVIVVNKANNWVKEISVADLKKIWEPAAQGKITRWNQVNPSWPDKPLSLYGAGSDSGTFDYFTEAVVGKAKSSRGDYTPSEDDNTIVNGVSRDKYALGYLPMSYYENNKAKLTALGIIGAKGKAVYPTSATVENGAYAPLSRPLFIYVNAAALKREEVRKFAEFYLAHAPKIVPTVSYVPLPGKIYEIVRKNLREQKTGTVFAGHSEVGLSMDQLLKKEGKL